MADFAFAPIKTTVGIAALEAWDIRVGAIERVEEIPRSDKLMKLIVNFRRPFTHHFLRASEKSVSNPRGCRPSGAVCCESGTAQAGEISEGMPFDVGYADGVPPALAVPERPVPNGTRAG